MKWHTLIIIIALLHYCTSECEERRSLYQLWEKKLHDELAKTGHVWDTTPNGCNVTEVNIRMVMKSFSMDSANDQFSMYSWTTLSWTDKRLSWNPVNYGGLNQTFFWRRTYWYPEIYLNNKRGLEYYAEDYFTQCQLESDGSIVCAPTKTEKVQCIANLRDWPYDTQQCTFEYGIGEHQKNVRLVSKYQRIVTMIGADYGPEWTIVDYKEEWNVSSTTQIKMTFVIERNGESLAAIVIMPTTILCILTTASFLLDVNDKNRLIVAIFTVMCHLFYLQQLGFIIPKHDVGPPRIVILFHLSIIFSVLFVLLTIFLTNIRNKVSAPPFWVSKIYDIVFESHGEYFIWPRWVPNGSNVIWVGFANTLNSVCIFVTIFMYSIMLSILIPTQPPFN